MANITLNIEECNTITPVNYGALYNWWAATDTRKITSSDDWVVPSIDSVLVLYNYLYNYAGEEYPIDLNKSLRSTGYDYWLEDEFSISGTNSSGFSAHGSGWRTGGDFYNIGKIGYWYSSSLSTEETPRPQIYGVEYDGYTVVIPDNPTNEDAGCSLRLLYTGAGTPTSYTGNDGKIYPVVLIGSQYWIACNLNETKYRNGDWITGFDGGVYTPISNANWAALTTEGMCYYNDDENNG